MKRDGLIFIDIITALFIISLIVVLLFPILDLTQKSFIQHKNITQMSYLSETIIEHLTLKDDQALDFLESLEKSRELKYPYIKDVNYHSTVKLLSDNKYLWELNVIIKDVKEDGAYVEIKASIPR